MNSTKPMHTATPVTHRPTPARALPALTLTLGSLLLGACGAAHADPPESTSEARPAVAVRVTEATHGPIDGSYVVTGTVRGLNTATLTSRVMGYVRTLDVPVGARVTRGQLLATLDDADPRAGLLQAQAGALEAQAARSQYEQQAQAAEAALRIARVTNERVQAMRADRAVSQQQADEAAEALAAAEAQHAATRAGVSRADSRIAQSRAMTLSARTALEFTRVRAPFDGVVLARPAQVGDLAAPGAPLYVIEQDGGVRVEVALPESLAGSVSLGQEVEVRVDANASVLTGTVGEIAPQVDPATRAFMVKVDLPSDATGLNPGMFARVRFDRPAPDALTVPVAAISARSSLDRLFVVEDGVAQLRLVTLGVVAGERVVVLSGLSPGESVVVDPPSNLRDRDSVEETR